MSHDSDPRPERIRARLSHPVVDADGHWLHYGPVFREQIRKVGGDTALEGVLSVSKATREALSMSVPERRRRGIDERAANAILIKVNKIGTLSETLEAIELAHKAASAV